MKKIVSILLTAVLALSALVVCAGAATATPPVPVAEAAYGTPVIDGAIDDVWSKTTAYAFDKYDYVKKITDNESAGQFRVLWDETYLYLLFEIKDNTMITEAVELTDTGWIGRDGVGMTFAPSGDRTLTNTDKASSFWFILRAFGTVANYSSQPQAVMVTEKEGATTATQNNFTEVTWADRMYKTAKTADGYLIEMKVNLNANSLTNTENKTAVMAAGTEIGFDAWIYGNDTEANGRHHVYYWALPSINPVTVGTTDVNNGGAPHKNNNEKGIIKLLEKPAPQPQNPTTGDSAWIVAAVAVLALGAAVVTVRKVRG